MWHFGSRIATDTRAAPFRYYLWKLYMIQILLPHRKLTWQWKITSLLPRKQTLFTWKPDPWKCLENPNLETILFRFHVKLWGCSWWRDSWGPHWFFPGNLDFGWMLCQFWRKNHHELSFRGCVTGDFPMARNSTGTKFGGFTQLLRRDLGPFERPILLGCLIGVPLMGYHKH